MKGYSDIMSCDFPKNDLETGYTIPKVSVLLITYNHQKFITQSVESVMMQETSFKFELVVGEDCSTDDTRQILLGFRSKYPDKIRLLLHDQNMGAIENFKQTIHACRGQYLAILQGDDYWTSHTKLQRQVDAMDNHPDWSICCGRNIAFYEDGSKESYLWPTSIPKPVSTLYDLVKESFVGASTSLFRNEKFESYPDWIFQVEICDYAITLFYAQFGKIGFFDEVYSAYRRHEGGIWSQRDKMKQRTALARDLRIIGKHMRWRHRRLLEYQAVINLMKVVKEHLAKGAISEARRVMNSILPMAYCLPLKSWKRIFRLVLMTYLPGVVLILRRIKWSIIPPKPDGTG